MRVFLFLAVAFLIGALYINRTYANIYNTVTRENLPNPSLQQKYLVKSDQNLLLGINDTQNQKYIALGDSLTVGVGSKSYEKTYPYIVAKKLSRMSSDVVLVNLGQPGARTIDVYKTQVPKVIAENPDYITLLIGVNDIHNFGSPDDFRINYQKIVDELIRTTHAKITLINIPYLGSDKLVLPPHNFWIDWYTKEYNLQISKIAQEKGMRLVDLYAKTRNDFNNRPNAYSSDLFHPSEEGYILWGQLIDAD